MKLPIFLLFVMVSTLLALQDAPLPNAVQFCQHVNAKDDASFCQCPTAFDGHLCQSEEPLPNFCKRMCGHAKQCHCCGGHQ